MSDVKVLPGSIDYAIAQIEKRFAPEIEQLRKERDEAVAQNERYKKSIAITDKNFRAMQEELSALRVTCCTYNETNERTTEERDALSATNARLTEALRIQDPRNATARYDMIADAFWKETGLWPPGRSAAPAMGIPESQREEAEKKWRPFVDRWHEDFFDRVLSPTPTREGGE